MYYIYMYKNKINGKSYVGKTVMPINKRKNGHRSESYNEKSKSYNDAFHAAFRKYGEDNFDFSIIEEVPEEFGEEYLVEREQFFIKFFHSHVSENGYNITWGGEGCKKGPMTFEECCKCSKVLTETEIRDIQQMLVNGHQFFEIKEKYPKITDSFLSNINNGWNFKRDDLHYPLNDLHSKFSKDIMDAIKTDIKNNVPYSKINEKYGISPGYISEINNGNRWFNQNESYPLCKKACNDKQWRIDCVKDILFTNLTYQEIAEKYGKSHAAVKAIAQGNNFHIDQFKYSLRKNKEENRKVFPTVFK